MLYALICDETSKVKSIEVKDERLKYEWDQGGEC
jgi:hypothetical protein